MPANSLGGLGNKEHSSFEFSNFYQSPVRCAVIGSEGMMVVEANHGEAVYHSNKAAAGEDTSLAVEVTKITPPNPKP